MNHSNHDESEPVQAPPPPRPGPAVPLEVRLSVAAADVIALAFNDCLHLSDARLPHARPDLQLLLRAHLAPALELAGLAAGSAAKGCVFRLVVTALQQAAAVRENEITLYLDSISAGQQDALLTLAHHALLAQPATAGHGRRPLPLYAVADGHTRVLAAAEGGSEGGR
jgi:hypothetical protein